MSGQGPYGVPIYRVAREVDIIDHPLTKRPIINRLLFPTVPVSPVELFAYTIETDNLDNFLCTLYRGIF